MTQSRKWTLTLCLALGLTSAAVAQPRPGGFGPGGLLMNPKVQKELKLTDDQIGKLKDALGKAMANHKDDFDKIRDLSRQERMKLLKGINDESHKAIASVLDDKQMKRFKQLEWQAGGVEALRDPQLQKALKLSEEQKKKLDAVFDDAFKKLQAVFEGGNAGNVAEVREKLQKIREETTDKANGVLSEEQKKSLKELKGQPFDLQLPLPKEKR